MYSDSVREEGVATACQGPDLNRFQRLIQQNFKEKEMNSKSLMVPNHIQKLMQQHPNPPPLNNVVGCITADQLQQINILWAQMITILTSKGTISGTSSPYNASQQAQEHMARTLISSVSEGATKVKLKFTQRTPNRKSKPRNLPAFRLRRRVAKAPRRARAQPA